MEMDVTVNKLKETDLFQPVKEFMEDIGYDVYSEVDPFALGYSCYTGRADIVGLHDNIVTVVELKNSLGLSVIEQAYKWKKHAHYVYVAVPVPKRGFNMFALKILKQEGIGLIEISNVFGNLYASKSNHVIPRLNRKALVKWKEGIVPEHKNLDGGHSGGGYVTRYSQMINKVKKYLKMQNKWLSIEQILEKCWTYYAQPKQSLSHALRKIEHDWCECKEIDGKLYYRYRSEE